MRAAAALLLVWSAAAAQEPARPVTVVLLPSAIWDSMSAIWSTEQPQLERRDVELDVTVERRSGRLARTSAA